MARFERAITAIDTANAQDPNHETQDNRSWPKELLYSHRMTRWLEQLAPGASEALRLAARAQHIRRWDIPRESFPMDRAGYHLWRTRLYHHHGDVVAGILEQVGYDDQTIHRVRTLLRKERIKSDPEMQTLEDVICLVFLENYFAEFRERKDYQDEKWVTILRRTWAKMSEQGHTAALRLPLDERSLELIRKALYP